MKIILTAIVVAFESLMIAFNTNIHNSVALNQLQDTATSSIGVQVMPYVIIITHCVSLWCLFQIWKDNIKSYWSKN